VTLTTLPEDPPATDVYAIVREHGDDWLIVVVNEDECLGCESCIEVCPSGAIVVTET